MRGLMYDLRHEALAGRSMYSSLKRASCDGLMQLASALCLILRWFGMQYGVFIMVDGEFDQVLKNYL